MLVLSSRSAPPEAQYNHASKSVHLNGGTSKLGKQTFSPTIVDLFENFLGEELSPSSIEAIGKISEAQLKELMAHLWKFEEVSWQNVAIDQPEYIFQDLDQLDLLDLTEMGAGAYVNRIKHYLLYYPRVHVMHDLDPISIGFSSFHAGPVDYLRRFLAVYVALKPLIQAHILMISGWPRATVTEPIISEINLNDSANADLMVEAMRLVKELKHSQKHVSNPLAVLDGFNIGQVLASVTKTNWTAHSEFDLAIHTRKLAAAESEISSVAQIESSAMNTLYRLNLPKIGLISAEDLIRIRQDEEAFQEWRNRLNKIFNEIPYVARFNDTVVSEVRDYAKIHLAEPIAKLSERSTARKVREAIGRSTIAFGFGGAALMVQSRLGDLPNIVPPLIQLGVSASAAFTASLWFCRQTTQEKIMRRVYSLFEL